MSVGRAGLGPDTNSVNPRTVCLDGREQSGWLPCEGGERGRECASRPGRLKCGDVRCVEDVVPADV